MSDINSVAADRLPGLIALEPARGTYVGHSAGLAITQQNGQKLFLPAKVTEPMASQFHSTTVSILARFSSGISAWSSRHIAWPYMAYVLMFETLNIQTASPRWLYVRHHHTVQPWDTGNAAPADHSALLELQQSFGIDLDKLDRWIQSYCSSAGTPGHTGRPFRDQVDVIFHLTALNLQIALLERQLDQRTNEPDACKQLRDLLSAQKIKRTDFLEKMQTGGSSAKL